MRHVSSIKNLDNLDAYLHSHRQTSNFLTLEIQSNLNLRRNGSYAAKSIECSNYKQGRTFSFIKQVLYKIIQFLPCHNLVLSFGRSLNHIKHFIEERCRFYSLSTDAPCFQNGRCNLLDPSWRGFVVKNIKVHANGRNKCQQLPTLLDVVGQQCCVRLHGPKRLTGFKLYATSANKCQQVPTLLWFHANGRNKSQHCWAQQCCVLVANIINVASVCMQGHTSLTGFKLYTTSANKCQH